MTTSAATPLDVLWRPRTIGLTILGGQGLALIVTLSSYSSERLWILFGLVSLLTQWIALLTLGALFLLRPLLGRTSPSGVAWYALLTLLAISLGTSSLAWALLGEGPLFNGQDLTTFLARVSGVTLTGGLMALIAFQSHWNSKRIATQLKQAELLALQARTNPHFLFNTLNTGISLVHSRPQSAEALLLDLAEIFRAALESPRLISLARELDLTERYLQIEHLRLGARLEVERDIDQECMPWLVPSLSLQPLVENAVRHGIEPSVSGGVIRIRIYRDDALRIEVTNSLPADEKAQRPGFGIGLASLAERLSALGEGRACLVTAREDAAFTASIRFPSIAGVATPAQATTS